MEESDKQLARRVLREALKDPDTEPAARVRAAQLLLAADAAPDASGDALQATDAELLAIARDGGIPPGEGPATPAHFSVPSAASAQSTAQDGRGGVHVPRGTPVRSAGIPIQVEMRNVVPPIPFDSLGRVPAAMLARGPKTDPPISTPPGPSLAMGPKTDPSNLTPAPAAGKKEPEPWE